MIDSSPLTGDSPWPFSLAPSTRLRLDGSQEGRRQNSSRAGAVSLTSPAPLSAGSKLVTLRDAASYITARTEIARCPEARCRTLMVLQRNLKRARIVLFRWQRPGAAPGYGL